MSKPSCLSLSTNLFIMYMSDNFNLDFNLDFIGEFIGFDRILEREKNNFNLPTKYIGIILFNNTTIKVNIKLESINANLENADLNIANLNIADLNIADLNIADLQEEIRNDDLSTYSLYNGKYNTTLQKYYKNTINNQSSLNILIQKFLNINEINHIINYNLLPQFY